MTTFGEISNERQWEWDREIEICRDFIDSRGLGDDLVIFARQAADAEIREETGAPIDEPPIGSIITTPFGDIEGDVAERMSDGLWLVVGEEPLWTWAEIVAAADAPITILRHGYGARA